MVCHSLFLPLQDYSTFNTSKTSMHFQKTSLLIYAQHWLLHKGVGQSESIPCIVTFSSDLIAYVLQIKYHKTHIDRFFLLKDHKSSLQWTFPVKFIAQLRENFMCYTTESIFQSSYIKGVPSQAIKPHLIPL